MADTRITIDAQIQMRHDTEANWMAADPVLRVGEPAYTIGMPDRFKIGDGQRKWSELPYLTMLEEDPEGPALPALGELADVEIEQPVEGQVLVYDEVRGMWVNRAVSAPDDEPESGPVFEFTYDTTTNKATAEMVAALAEAIADNKLILCNGRTYKFILEQDGMYGLVSDTYLDIMDGKLKASVLAVMASSYDVQLMEEEVPVGTEITEATIRNWGFTKNAGTITGIKMNGATKGTSGVVDLGNVLTEHQKLKTINNQSIVGEGNITIQGGGATPRVEMTASSAVLQPNTFHVWPMMDSLDLTLGAEQTGVMNRYLFQFRNPKAGLTMLTLPDTITWSEDTELDENGMPVMEVATFYRIEIIEGLASLKKWKLVYMNFADAEVERVLMANGVGDGIGITKRDAAAVSSVLRWFEGNQLITSFNELSFFKKVTALAQIAFYRCTALRSIDLSNVKEVGQSAFNGCVALADVGGCQPLTLSASAFNGCKALTRIDLSRVVTIGGDAFNGCNALADIVSLESVTSMGTYAFWNCKALTSAISMPNVKTIPNGAFSPAPIVSLNAPQVTSIGSSAFKNCKALASVSDMSRVVTIGGDAFNGCDAITSPIILEDVTSIGSYAFWLCKGVPYVMVKAVTPPTCASQPFGGSGVSYPIYVPDEAVEAYKAATNWNTYADRIKGISEYTG